MAAPDFDLSEIEDLEKFESIYNCELISGKVNPSSKFNYAWCLVRSKYKNDIKKGIEHLEELISTNGAQRDYLYYLSVGYYRLGDFERAKEYNDALLGNEPHNRQALSMKSIIEDRVSSEELTGLAIVGGAAAVVGALAVLTVQALRKR
eukprot:Nk52_evm5s77 gene=Nk52_evmTU5s77